MSFKNIKLLIMIISTLIFITSCTEDNSSSTEPNPPEPVAWESFINQNNFLSFAYDSENKILWAGTTNGLLKLDISNTENIKLIKSYSTTNGMLSNEVYSIMLNKNDNNLWIGTHEGISILDYNTNSFTSIVNQDRLYSNYINIIVRDTVENKIYVGTDDGINIFDIDTEEWSVKRFGTGFPENNINDIFTKYPNGVWFGTNGGAFFNEYETDEWFSFTENDELIDNEVSAFSYDRFNNYLYIGTKGGISIMTPSNFEFVLELNMTNGLSSNNINDINLFENQSFPPIFLYATNNGFNSYTSSFQNYFEEDGLTDNLIKDIIVLDEENGDIRSCITLTSYGLSKLDINISTQEITTSKKYFFGPYNYADKIINMTKEVEDLTNPDASPYNILFFTSAKGLFSFDPIYAYWNYYYSENEIPDEIKSIFTDNDNNIWVGTNRGVYKYNLHEFTLFDDENSGLPGNIVYSIFKDVSNNIWFGTNKGLAKFSESNNSWEVYDDENSGIPYKKTYAMTYDETNNYYWIGTKKGLAKFDGNEEWFVYDEENGLTNEHILELHFDNDNNLWILHEADDDGYSITKFDLATETFEIITATENGLINDIVYSIYRNNEKIYFGTYTGVCSYNTETEEWKTYENSLDFKVYDMSLINSNDEKEMWLTTDKGVSVMREF